MSIFVLRYQLCLRLSFYKSGVKRIYQMRMLMNTNEIKFNY